MKIDNSSLSIFSFLSTDIYVLKIDWGWSLYPQPFDGPVVSRKPDGTVFEGNFKRGTPHGYFRSKILLKTIILYPLQTHQLFWRRWVLRLLCTRRRPRSLLAISPWRRISCFPGLQIFGERCRLSLSRLQVRNSYEWYYLVDGYNIIIIIIHDNDAQLLAVFLWTLLHFQL